MLICDFCSTPNPVRKYDCLPFIMAEIDGVAHWSDNAWAACTVCAALIDSGKWDELLQRTLDTLPMKITRTQEVEYRAYLVNLHNQFRIARGQTA